MRSSGIHTFVEELLKAECMIVSIASRKVVELCIGDHETEILFKGEAILVFALLNFLLHRTEVHRVLDDLEVAGQRSQIDSSRAQEHNLLRSAVSHRINRLQEQRSILVRLQLPQSVLAHY